MRIQFNRSVRGPMNKSALRMVQLLRALDVIDGEIYWHTIMRFDPVVMWDDL